MKKEKRKSRKWRRIIGITLLALCCMGGVELMVCRTADPALYARLTKPVRSWWESTQRSVSNTASTLWEKLHASQEKEEELEEQLAGDPTIQSHPEEADPAVTALEVRDGQNILTGGSVEIVYYQQSAPEWADKPYGSDDLGRYGCGPTALSMAVSSMTERKIDPEEMAQWAVKQGYWAKRGGSYLSIVEGTAKAFGLEAVPFHELDEDALLVELASGKVGVALMTAGHFTNGGHFILLRGATLDGSVLVADPNSLERSLVAWDPQLILDELSASRTSGAPLWLLSLPES